MPHMHSDSAMFLQTGQSLLPHVLNNMIILYYINLLLLLEQQPLVKPQWTRA